MATRDQKTARRIIKRRGSDLIFQRYLLTKDRKTSAQSWVASGNPADTVTARAALIPVAENRNQGLEQGDHVLLVDGTPFPVDLDEDWRVTIKGEVHRFFGPVAICRTRPSDPAAYFEAKIRTGGATSGP